MNRKKIFLIIALMGLSITGITLMQIHWMLKTIRLNEENFDRAVNETLSLVVDKLEKEKDIKFSVPFQSPFGYENIEEYLGDADKEHLYPKRVFVSPENSARPKVDTFYRIGRKTRDLEKSIESTDSYNINFDFESNEFDKRSLEFRNRFIDSIKTHAAYSALKSAPNLTFTVNYTDTISNSIKVIQNDSVSRIIIISNGRIDTINSQNLPRTLIPPPPPPPTEVEEIEKVHVKNRMNQFTKRWNAAHINYFDSLNNRYKYEASVIALKLAVAFLIVPLLLWR